MTRYLGVSVLGAFTYRWQKQSNANCTTVEERKWTSINLTPLYARYCVWYLKSCECMSTFSLGKCWFLNYTEIIGVPEPNLERSLSGRKEHMETRYLRLLELKGVRDRSN